MKGSWLCVKVATVFLLRAYFKIQNDKGEK